MSAPLTPIALRPHDRDVFPITAPAKALPLPKAVAPAGIVNATTSHASSDPSQPKDSAGAAREFEALLIGQMLRSAHESGDQDDPTSDTMWDMAAQQFSRVLATNGGLGLAQIITKSLPGGQNHEDSAGNVGAAKAQTLSNDPSATRQPDRR